MDFIRNLDKNNCLAVMDTVCKYCKKDITPNDGMAIALGQPYYCLIHYACAPYFSYNFIWPHKEPLNYYLNLSSIFSNTMFNNKKELFKFN